MDTQKISPANVIKSLGLVFGDIGTSPIYTLAVIFLMTERTEANFIGILSLIIWTLLLLVTVEYACLAMSLSKGGEGGTIVLLSILRPLLQSGKKLGVASVLAFVGVSLLIGDGVITPAISILLERRGHQKKVVVCRHGQAALGIGLHKSQRIADCILIQYQIRIQN